MKKLLHWKGVLCGMAYGLVARAIFALEDFRYTKHVFGTWGLMTMSFMFLVPFVVGLLVAYFDRDIRHAGRIMLLNTSTFAVVGMTVFALLTGQEGLICAVMALPVFVIMSVAGGFIGMYIFKRRKSDKIYVSAFALLPFLLAPIENNLELRKSVFTEKTSIEINASKENVWRHITRVHAIAAQENGNSLFQAIGFPRPIEAELDTVAVGGVRKAVFDRGLFFTEIVTEVNPYRVLAFDIHADPASIPPKALDEHVLVGGKYFDVLNGRYEIEEVSNNRVILHLTSHFRLSMMFNFYSGLWSKLIMGDIQTNILKIVKSRSERSI